MHTAIATIKIRLRMLPTPKYIRRRKNVRAIAVTIPRRELAKIKEKVKRSAMNKPAKNRGTAPNVPGSMK